MHNAKIKLALKVVVSLALLTYLVTRADLHEIGAAMKETQWVLVLVVFLLFFVHFYIGTFRWRALARLHNADPEIGYLFRSYMVANFFNNFLPSTIGGDIIRIHDTWRAGTSRAGAAATILVERVLGVLSLAVLAAVGLFMLGSKVSFASELQWLVGILILALLTVLVLLFWPPAWWSRLVTRVAGAETFLVSRVAEVFGRVSDEFRGEQKTLFLALLLSFLIQANIIIEYYLIGIAIGIDLPLVVFVAIVPLALVVIMLPVSINGIGLREGVFTVLFGLFGIEVAAALVFSWILYALFVAHGLLGGIVYMMRKDRLQPPGEPAGTT